MESKFKGWKAKLLSQAGRATLVKHVATSIPVYTMSSILLPKGLCESLDKMARDFLWNNNQRDSRGFYPIAWNRTCQPKFNGGLGIRKHWSFNGALIAKLGWNLATKDNLLWVKAFKAKYFPHSSFMN